ncbi:unnamed protein product [Nippostrongylus brasiliensis]|uniref:VWFA domain-containing protein n=1 Tax=Nippostrongylus brasiliensis TaxID=27835 RepID=A0A0N4XNZ0_NIPBR|nr:unnamed protein product [Nippostrongylus brasiliensis]
MVTHCVVRASPLDLIFILDSSGSLRDKFQDEIDVIRRIVRHVTIGETATKVMLVQFRLADTQSVTQSGDWTRK